MLYIKKFLSNVHVYISVALTSFNYGNHVNNEMSFVEECVYRKYYFIMKNKQVLIRFAKAILTILCLKLNIFHSREPFSINKIGFQNRQVILLLKFANNTYFAISP